MDVYSITDGALKPREPEDIAALLTEKNGFVWVDVPECVTADLDRLAEVFGFHPMALKSCAERSHVP